MRSSPVVPPGRVARRDYVRAQRWAQVRDFGSTVQMLTSSDFTHLPSPAQRRRGHREVGSVLCDMLRLVKLSDGWDRIACGLLRWTTHLMDPASGYANVRHLALYADEPRDPSTDPRQTRDSHAPLPGHPSTLTRQLLAAPAAPPHAVTAATA